MKYILILVACLHFTIGHGQQSSNATPEMVVQKLFDGMRAGDSTMVKECFHADCTLKSVFTGKTGDTEIKEGSADKFVKAVGSPHPDVWDERISNLVVKQDAQLAQAWMDYSFYLGEVFSHCGVNAMHFVLVKDKWLIYQLVDTRRKTDCN